MNNELKRSSLIGVCIACMALSVGLCTKMAQGAVKGDSPTKGTYGATAIATASATKVFTGMTGRNAFSVFNHGPNTMWCGWNSAVTNVTGFPVGPETALSIDMTFNSADDKDFYCRADTAIQVSPLDTRWLQVK